MRRRPDARQATKREEKGLRVERYMHNLLTKQSRPSKVPTRSVAVQTQTSSRR